MLKTNRREYWIHRDPEIDVYEMYASEDADDYLGSFDTIKEAQDYAKQHDQEDRQR